MHGRDLSAPRQTVRQIQRHRWIEAVIHRHLVRERRLSSDNNRAPHRAAGRGVEPERSADWLSPDRRRRRLAELHLPHGQPLHLCLADLAELEMRLVDGAEKRGRESWQCHGYVYRPVSQGGELRERPDARKPLEWPKCLDVENLVLPSCRDFALRCDQFVRSR